MPMPIEVKPSANLEEFFQDVLTAALRNQGVQTSQRAEHYLVHLLSAFTTATLDDQPLGMRMAETLTAAPELRARTLRDIGDRSLYLTGFFADSLERGLVGVDYYVRIGQSAYLQLSYMPARGAPTDVYRELSESFAQLVEVLAEVSEGGTLHNPLSAIQLYERWRRTGAAWIERKLRALGMLPSPRELH